MLRGTIAQAGSTGDGSRLSESIICVIESGYCDQYFSRCVDRTPSILSYEIIYDGLLYTVDYSSLYSFYFMLCSLPNFLLSLNLIGLLL